jgi:multiple sugar transport system substrate-binding protein
VGGYALGIPANLAEERIPDVVEALVAFTSPAAQKLYVQNGSRTGAALLRRRRPRGAPPVADLRGGRPDVLARRAAVLAAPADPADLGIIDLCGEELHDMLRGS